MSKMYDITQEEVCIAWEAVRCAAGGPGLDGQTIQEVSAKLEAELYKIWNRMNSGSYQAQAVKIVAIPKAKGGVRHLGIPTVTDRIAQGIIKNRLEQVLEPNFHEDSYAYRAGRSAIDAVLKARERCFQREWVVEIDIKGFFDTLDHALLMGMVKRHTQDKVVLLYVRKFLAAKGVTKEGEELQRTEGTPQGGVVSPVLANLYLHEASDGWIRETYPHIWFERYADDLILHCVSEKQARFMLDQVAKRLAEYKLLLHPEKTRIIYVGKGNAVDNRGHEISRKFTFLGYDFKPRLHKGKIIFSPGLGTGAFRMINQQLKQLRLGSMTYVAVEAIAEILNAKTRGWFGYYGHARPSCLYPV